MGEIKEEYLNNIPNEEPLLTPEEKVFIKSLMFHLNYAVEEGLIHSEYADYLVLHPIEGVEWLRENMGVRLL